ncbi:MAG: hypothetical protein QM665_05850 [Desulfovibrio sp.]
MPAALASAWILPSLRCGMLRTLRPSRRNAGHPALIPSAPCVPFSRQGGCSSPASMSAVPGCAFFVGQMAKKSAHDKKRVTRAPTGMLRLRACLEQINIENVYLLCVDFGKNPRHEMLARRTCFDRYNEGSYGRRLQSASPLSKYFKVKML